jgi:putative ABC transport system permease protein
VIYASYLQQPSRYRAPWAGLFGQMLFMIRPAGDSSSVMVAARRAIAEIDPQRPLVEVSTMESHMRAATGQFRSFVWLVGVFAAVAVLLAAMGTYGVMAYTVSQRTREIGIRRALGAGRREIVALVGRRALAFVAGGLIAGLASALALTRLIASQLWGVSPTDPVTFAGVSNPARGDCRNGVRPSRPARPGRRSDPRPPKRLRPERRERSRTTGTHGN